MGPFAQNVPAQELRVHGGSEIPVPRLLRSPRKSESLRRREDAGSSRDSWFGVEKLLAAAADGKLSREELAYVRAGFFPGVAKAYEEALRPLGKPKSLELLEHRELGDDQIYRYAAVYEGRTLIVRVAVAPDGKVAQFQIGPR
jgi:hypothetical protein